jgi:hypothetical protein
MRLHSAGVPPAKKHKDGPRRGYFPTRFLECSASNHTRSYVAGVDCFG